MREIFGLVLDIINPNFLGTRKWFFFSFLIMPKTGYIVSHARKLTVPKANFLKNIELEER